MKAMEKLSSYRMARLGDLRKAKEEGRKIIGYTVGGYLPEELVLAAGAIPLGLIRGGDHSVVELAGAYICRWIDPFCRAQIGYGVSKDDPYYSIVDLLAIPITDNHIRAISDILSRETDIKIFPFGVPHMKDVGCFDYYLHGITRLKAKLEEVTGVEITESKLREAISLCNRERELLKQISLMRKSEPIPISSKDFVALNHSSALLDKEVMVDVLESLHKELKGQAVPARQGPRVLLTGSTLALGDRILDIIEEAGGVVVMEEFGEGLKPYWENVKLNGNLMEALADCYFTRRVPPAYFRPGTKRLDFVIKLAKDFNVAGVAWYQLLYRESYKTESYYFPSRLKRETGLPMLVIESEYDQTEAVVQRTRLETFMEVMRR
jgi:benzoyl-CoA reductase/2-hydroxyglutaryl-CoA dehydratase subunit BcrC/BadD/HgdB